jgi:hypothetical protein
MKFSLLIASAFYEIKAYSPYITSIMSSLRVLQESGVEYSYVEISGDSYVDRAKNSLVDKFLRSNFTHLMIIDSDLGWEIEGFARILKAAIAGAEIVGGAYLCKGDWNTYAVTPVLDDSQYVGNTDCGELVFNVTSLPGGFLIYSRKAFERTRPVLKTYDMDGPVLEAFRCDINDEGVRLGEDIYFQRKYIEQGGKIYLVPNVTLTHYGTKGYEGNYNTYVRRRPGGPDYPNSIERLRYKHLNETAWIIGKGPSLVHLRKEHIGQGPVIAISEAIIPVEKLGIDNPIYAMQKDYDPPEHEPIAPPQYATLLVQEREVAGRHKDYKPRYVFDNPMDFDMGMRVPSSITATKIAELLGCKRIVYISFDSCTQEEVATCHYNSDGTYKIISTSDPEENEYWREYKVIARSLKEYIERNYLAVEWITPERETDGTQE